MHHTTLLILILALVGLLGCVPERSEIAIDTVTDGTTPQEVLGDGTTGHDLAGPLDGHGADTLGDATQETSTDIPGDTGTDTALDTGPMACASDADCELALAPEPCQAPICDDGLCRYVDVSDDTSCPDDGLPCTSDVCEEGACTHPIKSTHCLIAGKCYQTQAPNPDKPCQRCDPDSDQTGWWNLDVGTACEEGDLCTTGDECDAYGICQPGDAVSCPVTDPECSTPGSCDPSTGSCSSEQFHPDGTSCTAQAEDYEVTVCVEGSCQGLHDSDFDDIPNEGFSTPCTNGQTMGCLDNCPGGSNPDQADSDGDGIGDVCDAS